MVSTMPKLVYLDSSDFSNLSAPDDELSREHRTILAMLREHKRAGTACYFMSAVHLSEAVHAAHSHKQAAVRRAELMRELCGSNTLRIPSDLPELELRKALADEKEIRLSIHEIKSSEGEWFGVRVPLEDMPARRASLHRELEGLLSNLPRKDRRKLRAELDLRKKSSHQKWRELLSRGARSVPLQYPLSLLDQKIVVGWFLGEISDAEFRGQVLKITDDPYVMFNYLLDEQESRERLYNSLRKAGDSIADELDDKQLIDALSAFSKSGVDLDLTAMIREFFTRPATLRQIISQFNVDAECAADEKLPKIIESCPSLHTFVEVNRSRLATRVHSYLSRLRAGKTSVKPRKASDMGDLMHSYYAPYFDIFRCDAKFGAHLRSHKPIRTRIADRIGDLTRMISNLSTDSTRKVA